MQQLHIKRSLATGKIKKQSILKVLYVTFKVVCFCICVFVKVIMKQ